MADKFFDAMFTASVIGGSSGPAPVIISKNITANGTYSALDDQADGFNPVIVDVPNTYSAADEGKVVSSGSLVAQTSTTATANGTIDTTTNNQVVVDVPNTYTAGDEGKVVSSGELVAQTAATYTANDTYDTTLINSVTVNVPTGINIYNATTADSIIESSNLHYMVIDNILYFFGTAITVRSAVQNNVIFNLQDKLSNIGISTQKTLNIYSFVSDINGRTINTNTIDGNTDSIIVSLTISNQRVQNIFGAVQL